MLLYTFNLSYRLILCLERMVRKHTVQLDIQGSKHFVGLEKIFLRKCKSNSGANGRKCYIM